MQGRGSSGIPETVHALENFIWVRVIDSVDFNIMDLYFHGIRQLLETWWLQANSYENIFKYPS